MKGVVTDYLSKVIFNNIFKKKFFNKYYLDFIFYVIHFGKYFCIDIIIENALFMDNLLIYVKRTCIFYKVYYQKNAPFSHQKSSKF